MSIILHRDFRELRQSNAFRIIVIVSALITVAAATGISIVLSGQSWVGDATGEWALELITGLIAYFMPLLILITFIWSFATLPITREKINGNIECLLATPLTPRALWLGKCLAVFLPGYAVSVISALLVLLAVNLIAIHPATGCFILPAPALLTGFIINPLLFFGLLAFMVLFSIANNPEIAIAPSFILGFGLMMGLPIGLATGTIDVASWAFALWYFIGTAVVWAIVLYLSRLLSKENIVLSSKGV
ncbi:MAG: ABC transporter permease [Dehalococcoidia bacterium]|jgi:ABC-2 type transport system permease protein